MFRLFVSLLALSLGAVAAAADEPARVVDLRNAQAVIDLQQSNPEHYAKIQQILKGLAEEPARAEADWLQTTFNAQDVLLSRFVFKTSFPAKQTLSFRLDDVRYTMNLRRSDLQAEPIQVRPSPSK
jgi:hypothetical protein